MNEEQMLIVLRTLFFRVNSKTSDENVQRVTSMIYDEAQEMIKEIHNHQFLKEITIKKKAK